MTNKPLPLTAPLLLVALFWVVFLAACGWAYMALHGHVPPSSPAPGAAPLTFDTEGFSRLTPKLRWIGSGTLGVVVILIALGVAMGDKSNS
ncbi:MAG TPA: hypothetical protein VGO93_27535 [Candidatus Xenobia bacterium]|jgi:hypothetical protein